MRFAMTARTVAHFRGEGIELNEMTTKNIQKVTRYRKGGEKDFEEMVEKINKLKVGERSNATDDERRWGGDV